MRYCATCGGAMDKHVRVEMPGFKPTPLQRKPPRIYACPLELVRVDGEVPVWRAK